MDLMSTEEKDDNFIPGLEWTEEDRKAIAAREMKERIYAATSSRNRTQTIRRVPESFQKAWESGEQTIVRPKGLEPEDEKPGELNITFMFFYVTTVKPSWCVPGADM